MSVGKAIATLVNASSFGLIDRKSVTGLFGGSSGSDYSPSPLPQPPSAADAVAKGEDTIRKKKSQMSSTIYSSPLGVSGEADIARKTLLGT